MTSFYIQRAERRFEATPLTRGPWDNGFQHGGPPAALLAGAMARFGEQADSYFLARITLELLRPVPLAELELQVESLGGRSVQRLRATLKAGEVTVLTALGLRILRETLELPLPADPPWPDPESAQPFSFTFFRHEVAYHKAVDLRLLEGTWGSTPIRWWARPLVPLLEGQPLLPQERTLILADAQSGMGVPVDPARYTFVNPDLTVYFEREPVGDWLGFDIRSVAGSQGVGLAQSALRDSLGVFGRSAQSLVVRPRR